MKKRSTIIGFIFFIFLLTGCSPIQFPEQTQRSSFISINSQQTIGQTFVTRFAGLNGIAVYLKPSKMDEGEIAATLYLNSESNQVIAKDTINLSDISKVGFQKFTFPGLSIPENSYLYVEFQIMGNGDVFIATDTGELYLNGAQYINRNPQDSQLTFRLIHDPYDLVIGLIGEFWYWGLLLLMSSIFYLLPGVGLLSWLLPSWDHLHWTEKSALAVGTSIAIFPVVALWAYTINLNPGSLLAFLPGILALIYLTFKYQYLLRKRFSFSVPTFPWFSITFIVVCAGIFASRFWAIRNLEAPMWGDSVQHTVITQLFLDNGGLFQSWLPYAPYKTFTVQYGFSLLSALMAWVTNMNSIQATLYTGQILNALAAILIYPLAVQIGRGNRWAGLLAVLVVGFFSPMPAYYVNWGRYAQLSGFAILPIAIWLAIYKNNLSKMPSLRIILLISIVFVGMTLSYYRFAYYAVMFCAIWFAIMGFSSNLNPNKKMQTLLISSIFFISITGFLILPWLINIRQSPMTEWVSESLKKDFSLDSLRQIYSIWTISQSIFPKTLIIFSVLALLFGLLHRKKEMIVVIIWAISLVAAPALILLKIPGSNFFDSFTIIISIFFPLGLVWSIIGADIESFRIRHKHILISIFFFILTGYGFIDTRSIADPIAFGMITKPDIFAMEWIAINTPDDSQFLVESFRIYNGSTAVGADAGWWIPLLSGRQNYMPPQYALKEVPIEKNYSQKIVDIIAKLEKISLADPGSVAILCEENVTHIFLGQRQGLIGSGAIQLFSATDLESNPFLSQIYHRDRTRIYEFDRSACLAPGT